MITFLKNLIKISYMYNYTPCKRSLYWFHHARMSVCPSVCLSLVRGNELSTHVLENLCIFFLKICTLITHHLKMCTLIFHIDWTIISLQVFLFFLITRNVVKKLWRILIQTLKMGCSRNETLYFLFSFTIFTK